MKIRLDIHILRLGGCLLAALLLFLGALTALHVWEEGVSKVPEDETADSSEEEEEQIHYNGAWYTRRDDVETVLVLGIDKYIDEQEQSVQGDYEQSDFLMLLILDKTKESCAAVHINRDTMTKFNQLTDSGRVTGVITAQITLAHAYGGDGKTRCRNSVLAVSNLFYGIPIDHYMSLSMDGVAILNDLVGGVPIEVEDDFSAIDPTLIQGEIVTLQGQQALTYVRTRKGLEDSSNIHRMQRQYQYLDALQGQIALCAEQDADFLINAILSVNDYLVSDCTVEQLADLADTLDTWGVNEYITLEGESVQGEKFMEFHPDEDALRALVMERFYQLQRQDEE